MFLLRMQKLSERVIVKLLPSFRDFLTTTQSQIWEMVQIMTYREDLCVSHSVCVCVGGGGGGGGGAGGGGGGRGGDLETAG